MPRPARQTPASDTVATSFRLPRRTLDQIEEIGRANMGTKNTQIVIAAVELLHRQTCGKKSKATA